MEGEAFLLGHWKNFYELEEALSIPELEVILTASRKQKDADYRFAAALKGIKLDGTENENRQAFEEVKARAAAIRKGADPKEAEFANYGIDVVTE